MDLPPRRSRLTAMLLAASVGGCQLVTGLGDLETDPTGAGGSGGAPSTSSSSGSPSSTSSTSNTSTTTSGTASSTSDASSSSSSTGSGGTELTPCAMYTDTFTTLDAAVWDTVGATLQSGQVRLMPPAAGTPALLQLAMYYQLDDCYATVRAVSQNFQMETSLAIFDGNDPVNQSERIGYSKLSNSILVNDAPTSAMDSVEYLGIALSGGQVYFFYYRNGWHFVSKLARPTWMDDGADDLISMRCKGTASNQCTVDDFNVMPLHLSDLPP